MAASIDLLLVEGEADQGFFIEVCRQLKLHPDIKIAPPKERGGERNSKQGVYNLLGKELKQLADGRIRHLAAVVDADYSSVNPPDGFDNTLAKFTEIVAPYDFVLKKDYEFGGLIFENNNGLADFGVWIMPNNQHEGMLEDFIKSGITSSEQGLFDRAAQSVATIAEPKFKPHHLTKAEIATWLAWQKDPGHGLYMSVKDTLLDQNSELFQQLSAWLRHIYP